MSRRDQIETSATVFMAGIALVMLALYVSDRRANYGASGEASSPLVIADWERYVEHGVWRGASDPDWVVVEFMDFTCPYCSELSAVTDSLLAMYPDRLGVVTMYFPLGSREHALGATKAAECARRQDRFEDMYHILFAQQEAIGSIPWQDLAVLSEVEDVDAFALCMSQGIEHFDRISMGRDIGISNGVMGTPTVWMDGRVVSHRTVSQFRAAFEGEMP